MEGVFRSSQWPKKERSGNICATLVWALLPRVLSSHRAGQAWRSLVSLRPGEHLIIRWHKWKQLMQTQLWNVLILSKWSLPLGKQLLRWWNGTHISAFASVIMHKSTSSRDRGLMNPFPFSEWNTVFCTLSALYLMGSEGETRKSTTNLKSSNIYL